MSYKVVWSEFAESQIDKIFEYYLNRTKSEQIALKIINELLLTPNILIDHPELGQKEPLLIEKEQGYRYIVKSNYKIIYYIEDSKREIRIADVFDARQNPIKIKRKK